MNFDKIYTYALAVVLAFAAAGQLDRLQRLIWRAQAELLHEGRASNWGSPRFFPMDGSVSRRGKDEMHE